LAITKELIQRHNGRICAESKLNKGSKFIFTLPKYTAESLFKEYVNNGIKDAMKKDSKMSLIVASIADFDKLKKSLSIEKIKSIVKGIEDTLKNGLRRTGDVSFKDTGEIVVILVDCDKENALRVEGRLEQALDDYLASEKLTEKIELRLGCATYPDDAKTDEELLKKAKKA
jgi:diguanylate cyclase (GGDEF)-like protein